MRGAGVWLCVITITLLLWASPTPRTVAVAPNQSANPNRSSADISAFAPGYAGIVFTQMPVAATGRTNEKRGLLRADYGEGSRLALLSKNGDVRVLTTDFHSGADPAVSFDGRKILFAGKKSASDRWNIFEMAADGSGVRQITKDMGNCRSPKYQPSVFYLNDPKPSYQITFVSDAAGELNEGAATVAANLYSIRLDGTGLRRLTYGISSSYDPAQMQDGRIVFSHLRARSEDGTRQRIDLFGVHLDGTDLATFSGHQGKPIKHMATATAGRLLVFVESDSPEWDGSGSLASLDLRRNLHSYRAITAPAEGRFHSPSPLPDGSILVSMRPAEGSATHSIYRLAPRTGQRSLIFSDPHYQNVQAVAVVARPEPDGHSSVVEDDQQWSKLYCLSSHVSDRGDQWPQQMNGWRVRVIEGMPADPSGTSGQDTLSQMVQTRLLGETRLDEDGSFHLSIPPNLPVQVQLIDENGLAVRSSSWIWTKNKENRGCIGCHEDNELTPENVFAQALGHPAAEFTLPPERRRTVDFRRDIMPIFAAKCASCHEEQSPRLSAPADDEKAIFENVYAPLVASRAERYVDPGRARTSRLAWSLMGKNTARPWDHVAAAPAPAMPPAGSPPLTEQEKEAIFEWIDLGAQFHALPSHATGNNQAGGQR